MALERRQATATSEGSAVVVSETSVRNDAAAITSFGSCSSLRSSPLYVIFPSSHVPVSSSFRTMLASPHLISYVQVSSPLNFAGFQMITPRNTFVFSSYDAFSKYFFLGGLEPSSSFQSEGAFA